MYREGDDRTLAAGLRRWFDSPEQLLTARRAAWAAGARRWHWEHPSQQGALLAVVESALSRKAKLEGSSRRSDDLVASVEARA